MTAVDPGVRIRHPLDVFHSTFNPGGTNVTAGYLAAADGLGRTQYVDPATISGTAMVPTYIASGDTFTVPIYRQALFTMPIDVVGILVVDGYLVEVT